MSTKPMNVLITKSEATNPPKIPMLDRALRRPRLCHWLMSPAEQAMMLYLLERLRPKVAIEIGTRFGGSLQVLAEYCDHIYSLDIDPDVPARLEGQFSNVSYLIGPSDQTLPQLIDRLHREKSEVGFVLVDGDHSAEGVRKDMENLLRIQPLNELYIIMHDSFNPIVRRGLMAVDWAACPYVHRVELDLVPGFVTSQREFLDQLWGGLALAVLEPEPRIGDLQITAWSQLTYDAANLALGPGVILRKVMNKIGQRLRFRGR